MTFFLWSALINVKEWSALKAISTPSKKVMTKYLKFNVDFPNL